MDALPSPNPINSIEALREGNKCKEADAEIVDLRSSIGVCQHSWNKRAINDKAEHKASTDVTSEDLTYEPRTYDKHTHSNESAS